MVERGLSRWERQAGKGELFADLDHSGTESCGQNQGGRDGGDKNARPEQRVDLAADQISDEVHTSTMNGWTVSDHPECPGLDPECPRDGLGVSGSPSQGRLAPSAPAGKA